MLKSLIAPHVNSSGHILRITNKLALSVNTRASHCGLANSIILLVDASAVSRAPSLREADVLLH